MASAQKPFLQTVPHLVTAQAVAAAIGCSISWVYEAAAAGRIPSYRVGRRLVRFDLDEVIQASRAGAPA